MSNRGRTVAHYRIDSRRHLRGRSPEFLSTYIGRHLIQVLVADDFYKQQVGSSVLGPALHKALALLEPLALKAKEKTEE